MIINGPNLSLLGSREPDIYGRETLKDIEEMISLVAEDLGADTLFFQSNVEGEIVNKIIEEKDSVDGIIINAGAYTHTSVAIPDAIKATESVAVEVHLSNIYRREVERHTSLLSAACIGQVSGFGANSYLLALRALINELNK